MVSENALLTADQWRQVVDSAVETAIISTDASGYVTSWSEGARRVLGWTAAEMIGQSLERIFPEDKGKAALGARFDLRRFDDAVVLGGSVPMTLLETVIDAFIAKSKG